MTRRHRSLEPVEDALLVRGVDTDSPIRDGQYGRRVPSFDAHANRLASAKLQRVRQEIHDHLLDPSAIPESDHGVSARPALDPEIERRTFALGLFTSVVGDGLHDRRQVHGFRLQPQSSGDDARDVQQLLDEMVQSLALSMKRSEALLDPFLLPLLHELADPFLQRVQMQLERRQWRFQLVRRDRDELLPRCNRGTRLLEEPRVVEGHGAAAREVLSDDEIGLPVVAAGARADERDDAECLAVRHETDGDRRTGGGRLHQVEVLLVVSDASQPFSVEIGKKHGRPAQQHLRRRMLQIAVRRRGEVHQGAGQGRVCRIAVRDLHAADVALFVEQVEEAPVGEGRDREPGDARHGLVRVERLGQHGGGISEKSLSFLLDTKPLQRRLELAPARRDLKRERLEISAVTRALAHEDVSSPLRVEETLHPRAQLPREEGLRDVVLGALPQEIHSQIFVGLGGQQHDRNRIELAARSDFSQSASPLMTGIMMSLMMRSGALSSARISPSRPSCAETSRYGFPRHSRMNWSISRLSSTIRTVGRSALASVGGSS